jgi:hypothetical protein
MTDNEKAMFEIAEQIAEYTDITAEELRENVKEGVFRRIE